MDFGGRIKTARLAKGYTQEQLAKMIGVAKSTLTGYEKGNREPDVFKIKKLAEALNTTGDYLICNTDDPSPPQKAKWTIEEFSESPLSDNSMPVELKRGTFADKVNKYMLQNNVSQKDICDLLGVDGDTVSRWLDGDELPNVKTVDVLADLFHVRRNNLLDKKTTVYDNSQEEANALSDDVLEVARAYAALPDDKAKNMIRGALGLSALKRGAITANDVEVSEESHPDTNKKAI